MISNGTKYLQGNAVELSLAEGYELVKEKAIEFVASEVDLVTDQRLLDMDIFTTGIQSKISLSIYENQKFSINVFSTEGGMDLSGEITAYKKYETVDGLTPLPITMNEISWGGRKYTSYFSVLLDADNNIVECIGNTSYGTGYKNLAK